MKELSIEQKATAYEDLLKKAKQYYDTENDVIVLHFLEELFPELCESEDEKVKEDIISLVNELCIKLEKQDEQKSAWSEEDERLLSKLQTYVDMECFDRECNGQDLINWLKSIKQRYALKPSGKNKKLTDVNHEYFSELLENNNSNDINDYAYQVAYCMSHDWIEETATWDDVQKACKLGAEWKEKHLNNSSTAWSEEDEQMIGKIRNIIENYAFSQSAVDVNGDLCEKEYIDTDNWLKFLKDRYFWKPSYEQMDSLEYIIDNIQHLPYSCSVAKELLEQLKKIKGE